MVSIIVAIYNVSAFIERGIHNVLAQTYRDFELILIDDGSTDCSYDICRQWAAKDPRIKVIHQENKGLGAARNHGQEVAQGDYIYFFDFDDEISPRLLDYCVKTIEDKGVDLVCFGYNNVETTYRSTVTVTFPETTIRSNKELRDIFTEQFALKANGFQWNKFYRKAFLDKYKIRCENQRIEQDEVFNLKCYRHLEKAFLSPEVLYTYYIYEKGNNRAHFIPDRFDIYKSIRGHFEELKAFWMLDDARLNNCLDGRFYENVIKCMTYNLLHPECPWSRQEKLAEMDRILADPLTRQAFRYAQTHETGLEQRLLRGACTRKNLPLIRFYYRIFGFLHNVRKRLKR